MDTSLRWKRLPALAYRDFRLVWVGELLSTIGSQMQSYAVDWHVFQLLRGQSVIISGITMNAEALGLGMLGLARILPIIIFAVLGGLVADVADRRKVMIITRVIAAGLAAVLAFFTLNGSITLEMIYLLTALTAGSAAFDSPSRQSLVPNLVAREHLSNAVSLNAIIWQIATIVGPALTGLIIGISTYSLEPNTVRTVAEVNANIGIIYGLNVISFVVAIVVLMLIRHRGTGAKLTGSFGLHTVLEGMRFTYSTRIIWGSMLLDFFATLFASARTMLPIVASSILHLDATGYGLLATAQAVGALVTSVFLALRPEIYYQGRALLWGVVLYGAATVVFGLSDLFIVSYIAFALTGVGDTVSSVIRATIRQILTPDRLRGRMTSVNMIFFMGGPQLGELEAGVVAAVFGVPFAIVSGGVVTVLFTIWIAWKYPLLREYTRDTGRDALIEASE